MDGGKHIIRELWLRAGAVGAGPFVSRVRIFQCATLCAAFTGEVNFQSLCNTGAQRLGLRLTRAPNDSTGFVEKLNAPVPIFVDSKFSLRNTRIIDQDKSLSTNFFWWRSLGLCVDEHWRSIMRKHSAQKTRSK